MIDLITVFYHWVELYRLDCLTYAATVGLLFSSGEAAQVRGRCGPPGGVALYVYSIAHRRAILAC